MLHLPKEQIFGMLSAISCAFPRLLMLDKGVHGHRILVLWGVCCVKGKGCSCACSPKYCPGRLMAARVTLSPWLQSISTAFPCAGVLWIPDPALGGFPMGTWWGWAETGRERSWGFVNVWQEHVRLSTSKAVHRGETHAQPGLCCSNWSHRVPDSLSFLQLMGLVAEIWWFNCEISSLSMILHHTLKSE